MGRPKYQYWTSCSVLITEMLPSILKNRAELLTCRFSAILWSTSVPTYFVRLYHAVLCIQGKYGEAGALYERCQAIQEKVLGPEHPALATTLRGRARLLENQVGKARSSGTVFIPLVLMNLKGSSTTWGWWRARCTLCVICRAQFDEEWGGQSTSIGQAARS